MNHDVNSRPGEVSSEGKNVSSKETRRFQQGNENSLAGNLNSLEGNAPRRRWQPYPEYKDSGVEWLGEIPTHWEVCPLRRKLRDGNEGIKIGPFGSQLKLEFMQETGYKVYGQEHVIADDFTVGSKYVGEQKFAELSACSIQPGDLLVTMMGSSGRCRVVPPEIEPGLMDSHLLRLRVREDELHPHFTALVIDQGPYVKDQLLAAGKGAIMHGLNSTIVKDIVLAIPPLPEQRAIAAFLDRETAKLDALAAKQERLIELLQEERAALISHAVTKGLDSTVPMRDSGIPWLGEIPAHWEVKQIRYIAESLQTGPFGSQLHSSDYVTDGIPVINPSHMKDGHTEPDREVAVDDETCERLARHKLCAGDIVFARRGELGRCALITSVEEGWLCGTGSLRMRPKLELTHPPYLNRVLSTDGVGEWLLLQSVGSTMDNLNTSILSRLPLPIPPFDEQYAIATHLDRETAKLDALIAKAQEMIDRLHEYRTALISAAVTGKIDVREAS